MPPKSAKSIARLLELLLPAVVLVPMIFFPLSRDQGIFTYAGQVILDGGFPYRDILDQKAPGTHYTFALALALFGNREISVWIFFYVVAVLGTQLAAAVGRRVAGEAAGLPCALFYALVFLRPNDQAAWNMGQSEDVVLVLCLAAILVVHSPALLESGRRMTASGALLGLACLYKQTAAVVPLALSILVFGTLAWRRVGWRKFGRQLLLANLGLIAPTALLVAYFAFHGLVEEFWTVAVEYNVAYADVGISWRFARQLLWQRLTTAPMLWLAVLGIVAFLPRRLLPSQSGTEGRFLLLMLALVTAANGFALVWQRKMWGYHWTPFLVCLAVLAGCGAGRVAEAILACRSGAQAAAPKFRLTMESRDFLKWCNAHRIRLSDTWPFRTGTGILVTALVLWWTGVASHSFMWHELWRVARGERSVEDYREMFAVGSVGRKDHVRMAGYLRESTSPGETVMVWGYECVLYVLSDRRSPSRFALDRYLCLWNFYRTEQWREEFLQSIRESPPKYFLVLEDNATFFCRESIVEFRQFEDLYNFVNSRYDEVGRDGKFHIYRLRSPAST